MANGSEAQLLKPSDVAERLGIKTPTVWNWCRAGKLPHIRLSARSFRIRQTDLEAFLAGRSR